jgi:SpoVK/Ycf46/Vps4 family AAA+-type ATPase
MITVREPDPIQCPPYFIGFSLSRKEWCHFLVDSINEVQWNENVWKSLILEEQEKFVLRALVSSHMYHENPRDQPQQKGKGLVILLHGAPGSGKTLTAETVAEGTCKALVSTTLAELNKTNR